MLGIYYDSRFILCCCSLAIIDYRLSNVAEKRMYSKSTVAEYRGGVFPYATLAEAFISGDAQCTVWMRSCAIGA